MSAHTYCITCFTFWLLHLPFIALSVSFRAHLEVCLLATYTYNTYINMHREANKRRQLQPFEDTFHLMLFINSFWVWHCLITTYKTFCLAQRKREEEKNKEIGEGEQGGGGIVRRRITRQTGREGGGEGNTEGWIGGWQRKEEQETGSAVYPLSSMRQQNQKK